MDDLTRVLPLEIGRLALHFTAGINKDILIGMLRSIAEPSGTDKAVTLGLALARPRTESIVQYDMALQSPSLAATRRESANVCGNPSDPKSCALKARLNAATTAPVVRPCNVACT